MSAKQKIMKSILYKLLFLFFVFTRIVSTAQISSGAMNKDSVIQISKTGMKNTVYAEILGNAAGLFSINYDRIVFKKEKISLSFSIGAGMVPGNLINNAFNEHLQKINYLIYGIPISLNLSFGRKNHHLETGLGITYQQGMFASGLQYSKTVFAVIRIGYRYQKENGGYFWKIGFTPFFPIKEFGNEQTFPFIPLGGLALGYTFK